MENKTETQSTQMKEFRQVIGLLTVATVAVVVAKTVTEKGIERLFNGHHSVS